jgi:flagellar motility protein MotE (MotC chaperone)
MSEQSDIEFLEQERYDALQEIAFLKNDIKKLEAKNEKLRTLVDVLKTFLDGDCGYSPLEEALAAVEDDAS